MHRQTVQTLIRLLLSRSSLFAILQADTFFLHKLILSKPLVNSMGPLGDTILTACQKCLPNSADPDEEAVLSGSSLFAVLQADIFFLT